MRLRKGKYHWILYLQLRILLAGWIEILWARATPRSQHNTGSWHRLRECSLRGRSLRAGPPRWKAPPRHRLPMIFLKHLSIVFWARYLRKPLKKLSCWKVSHPQPNPDPSSLIQLLRFSEEANREPRSRKCRWPVTCGVSRSTETVESTVKIINVNNSDIITWAVSTESCQNSSLKGFLLALAYLSFDS